jgi:hypothetical protein
MAVSALISESAEGAMTARAAPTDAAKVPVDEGETSGSRVSLDTQLESIKLSGGEDDMALSDMVGSARKKFISLGLGPVLVETLREHPSCRQVCCVVLSCDVALCSCVSYVDAVKKWNIVEISDFAIYVIPALSLPGR